MPTTNPSNAQTLTANEVAAIERLIVIAKRDTGQSRRVAAFLLAWWNAETCGGFDLTDLWSLDVEIRRDMLTVFYVVARVQSYPDTLGFGDDFRALIERWRPQLVTGEG